LRVMVCLLCSLSAVTATCLLTVLYSGRIECTTDDLVTNAWQVAHTTTAYQHDGVFLQVVSFTRDVGGDFDTAGETNACNLAQRGVGLLGGGGEHARADTATLRGPLQCRRLGL